MMKNNLLILLGIMLLLVPLATALEDKDADYIIKQYSSFDLKRPCFNNGTWCGVATNRNITVSSAQLDGAVIVDNLNMTNQGSYFNFTITNTQDLGFYQVNIVCLDRGDTGSEVFYYKITSTGSDSQISTFLMIAGAIVLILILALVSRNEYLAFVAGCLSLVLGVFTYIYGFNGIADMYTQAIAMTSIGIGLLYCVASAWSLVENSGKTGMEEVIDVES